MKVLGLMSGTSLDGIDLALIETDGESVDRLGPAETIAYDDDLRRLGRAALAAAQAHARHAVEPEIVREAARRLTLAHAEAVAAFRKRHDLEGEGAIDLVGFHGQTVLHRPEQGWTWQIGDGDLLSRRCGLDVISDFRSADVAAGGQGAPLVPLYHRALARSAGLSQPVAILNVGGVANVTWVDPGGADPVAFDTGPGNALLDDWVHRHGGGHMDEGGRLAASGQVREDVLARLLAHSYFTAPAPKSLDRNTFVPGDLDGAGLHDGAATLAAFTVAAVELARAHFPAPASAWYVTGGGRHNPTLMDALARKLDAPVAPVEVLGWRGDALEAEAFAFLAARAMRGLPLSLPTTTGVRHPTTGGRMHKRPV